VNAKMNVSPEFCRMMLQIYPDKVLTGPDRDEDDVDIDPIMGATFQTAMEDFCSDAEILRVDPELTADSPEIRYVTNTRLAREETLLSLPGGGRVVKAISSDGTYIGVAAITPREEDPDTFRLAGLFTGCALCVSGPMRGRGIGKALVIARFLLDEELPTWDHDTPGYSPGGADLIENTAEDLAELSRYLLGKTSRRPELLDQYKLDVTLEEPQPCP